MNAIFEDIDAELAAIEVITDLDVARHAAGEMSDEQFTARRTLMIKQLAGMKAYIENLITKAAEH